MRKPYLRQCHFASIQRIRNAPDLLVKPIRVVALPEKKMLDISRDAAWHDAKTLSRPPHQNAIRAQHRAIRIHAYAPVRHSARVQPSHCFQYQDRPLDNRA